MVVVADVALAHQQAREILERILAVRHGALDLLARDAFGRRGDLGRQRRRARADDGHEAADPGRDVGVGDRVRRLGAGGAGVEERESATVGGQQCPVHRFRFFGPGDRPRGDAGRRRFAEDVIGRDAGRPHASRRHGARDPGSASRVGYAIRPPRADSWSARGRTFRTGSDGAVARRPLGPRTVRGGVRRRAPPSGARRSTTRVKCDRPSQARKVLGPISSPVFLVSSSAKRQAGLRFAADVGIVAPRRARMS